MPKISLKAKMWVTIALLVPLSLAVMAVFIFVPLQNAFRHTMRSEVGFVASGKADQLHGAISTVETALQAMASNEVLRTTNDKDGAASRFLRDMQQGLRANVSRLMLVDGSGVVVAAGDRGVVGKRLADLWHESEISHRYQITPESNLEALPMAEHPTLAVTKAVESSTGTSLALVAYLNWQDISQQMLNSATNTAATNGQALMVLLNGHGRVLAASHQLNAERAQGTAQSLQDVGITLDSSADPATAPDADLEMTVNDQHFRGRSVEVNHDLHWSLMMARPVDVLDNDLHALRNFALMAALAMTVICTILGFRMASGISDALLTLVPAFDKLATGNLDCQLPISSDDEVAHIAKQFNEFVDRLRTIVSNIIESTQTLSDSSRLLADLSKSLVSNAQETSSQASSASQISDEVSTNINTVSAGVEEMSLSINEIARSSDEAARVATSAVRIAEMTNTTVQELGGSSSEIGNVIKVINSIAEQTNLLALNATIEAARAGEAGKGFAVVANEVKELAKETARATEDIGKKIEAIQAKTKGAVSAIGEIGSIINQVNDYQTTIASAVQEQLATTTEIGRNIAEVAERSYMITKNITAVAQFAQSASTGASDTQEASSAVSRISADLHRVVEAFRYTAR